MESDLYGFELPPGDVRVSAIRLQCDGLALRAERAWAPYIEQGQLPPAGKLKELVRQGVPPAARSLVWMAMSGAAARRSTVSPAYYSGMAAAAEEAPAALLSEVEQDAKVVAPNHAWLSAPDGQAAVRRVIGAFLQHNPKIGYSRPLSRVVALLLVVLNRNQESAFWVLAQLVEHVCYENMFARDLAGCQVEMRALEDLISTKMPRLAAHLSALEADVGVFAAEWFLSLFAFSLPAETTARVWDALLNEGPKVLYRVALALLTLHEGPLLAHDNAGELALAARAAAAAAHDRDGLMMTAFEGVGSLPMAVIDRHRSQGAKEVAAAVADGGRSPRAAAGEGSSELRELREKAGMMGHVAASGVKKGFGAIIKSLGGGGDKRSPGGASLG